MHCKQTWFYVKIFMYFDFCLFVKVCTVAYWCTAELLASLLLIPQGKTLLRRHLATHFNQLVGREVVQAKREMETSSAYPPLIPVVKVKVSFVAIHSNQSS